ncbi:MAG: hypothetical protein IPL90_17030 [Holophagales bacterium]|nr:hypothetical protein [Holophagales bacterium]
MDALDHAVATAVLGLDTLWGGDVMNPSGLGRFIADSWFSDEPLPAAYTGAEAARLRAAGGTSAKPEAAAAVDAYLAAVDVRGAIALLRDEAGRGEGLRARYLEGLGFCFEVMLDLALEVAGKAEPVPYERCMRAILGRPGSPSDPAGRRERVRELLAAAGFASSDGPGLLAAVDAWRAARIVPKAEIPALSARFVADLDELAARNVVPHLPAELARVPRANVTFLMIENAWFSGSMNYLGRARRPDGSPEYEATYELNASLEISRPEFAQLVSHEVVPGHVTTFAYLQDLYVRGVLGFEASVLTMNTRPAALFEGIANNAILMAHGVLSPEELPDRDLETGCLLALLQDDAKNQSSWLTWNEKWPVEEVARVLRNDYLVSDERADKLSGAWGRHPLLGRMYLPAYRAGTEKVAELRRKYPREKVLPALFGCRGVVDLTTVEEAVAG